MRLFTEEDRQALGSLPQEKQKVMTGRLLDIILRYKLAGSEKEVQKVENDFADLIADIRDEIKKVKSMEEKSKENGIATTRENTAPGKKRSHDGPNFMARLVGREVKICYLDGEIDHGIVRGYNRYEIVLEMGRTKEGVHFNLVMKHAIATITPIQPDDNLFAPKPESAKPEVPS